MDNEKKSSGSGLGLVAAWLAFGSWGLLPLFWRHLTGVPPLTIIACRTLSSLAVLLLVASFGGRWRVAAAGLRSSRLWWRHGLASALLAGHWLLYVWATLNHRMIDAALGYYLNPFCYMLIGWFWLGERQNRWQLGAVGLAMLAVLLQMGSLHGFPWLALVLAVSFSVYALLGKQSRLDSLSGLCFETTLMAPLALWWLWHVDFVLPPLWTPEGMQGTLLLLTGLVTAVPLLSFGVAARHLSLTTLGVMQFIAPSLQFLIGWLWNGELMSPLRWLAFVLLWIAIVFHMIATHQRHAQGQHDSAASRRA